MILCLEATSPPYNIVRDQQWENAVYGIDILNEGNEGISSIVQSLLIDCYICVLHH